jgi:ABC-type branched-subunit amino acid transport system substrate-binding protein
VIKEVGLCIKQLAMFKMIGGNKMKEKKSTIWIGVVFIFCFLVFLSFCNEGSSAEKEIVIGSASDISGPWAPSGTGIANGRKAYARYVNEKLGGIKGVKITVNVIDTAYNMDREIAAYKRFRDEDKAIFMLNQNSAAAYAIERMMLESGKGMPHSHTAEPTAVFLGPESWYFASFSNPGDASVALLKWWMSNRWKGKEKPKVALTHSDISPGHVSAILLRDYLNHQNIPIVEDLILPPRPVDTTSFVLNVKKGGADLIVGVQTDSGYTVMIKDKERFGLAIPVLASCCLDENALKLLGDAGVGVLVDFPNPVWNDVDNPGVRLVHSLYKEWYPSEPKTENYAFFWGWVQSAIAVEAIKKAMDKVGYDGLMADISRGRKLVRDVMQNEMRGFDCMGMTGPLIYSPEDHRAFDTFRVYEGARGGEFKFLGWAKSEPLRAEQKTAKWWEDAIKAGFRK